MTKYSRLAVAAIASSAVALSYLVPGASAFSPLNSSTGTSSPSCLGPAIRSSSSRAAPQSSALSARQESYNPLSMFGDLAASFIPGGGGGGGKTMGEANAQLDATISSLVISQWEDVRSKLEAVQTEEEKHFRPSLEKGIGRASPLNTIRLFDESNTEDDVRVVFYRDHASWCPYCHKVWLSVRRLTVCCLPFAMPCLSSCAGVLSVFPFFPLALRLAPSSVKIVGLSYYTLTHHKNARSEWYR